MSIIAALMLGMADAPAPPAMTADQAAVAYRKMTAVPSDRCVAASDDEIIVCGRRKNPYALPLYDASADEDASRYGGNRVGQMAAIKETESACAKQSAFCMPPAAVNFFQIVPALIKGAVALATPE